ncbi:hypothetical protein EC957_009551 [Mortierella hygrophila]|uniref:Uncharacterized protein n=1 Tax=Mortierella hygrophila TaxID=979708 RepID=A0A9P6K536_9FUNG|nr:hypothetical protein EC957_009551 [Mortierella hygrophila]
MVGRLFNDLVTALDILPESPTVDICINHPSPAVLAGKVRVIAKRPCVYKSLVLTVTGTSRVWMRQGAKTIKAKQVFLKTSKEIVFEGHGLNGGVIGGESRGVQTQQQQRQQQRASSLSSMTSLSNSHPSNIPVSPLSMTEVEAFPSTSTTTPATAAAAAAGAMTRMSRMTTSTTTTASAQQPVRSREPSHGFSVPNNATDDDDSSPMTHLVPLDGITISTLPTDNNTNSNTANNNGQQPAPLSLGPSPHNRDNSNSSNGSNSNNNNGSGTTTNGNLQNQLRQGVNDIDFYLEFPSHMDNTDTNNNSDTSASDSSRCLPSGPFKSFSGDSTIVYTLSATLVMSRRDILVNNQMTISIPFRIQCWQDMVDWRNHSEDHSYHGKRRGKIEFRLQVPKQLDIRRLQDLQFGFDARWKTLQDRLKIKEVHYSIVEEETQILGPRMAPNIHTTVISTAVTHSCAGDTTPTDTWNHMRGAARLQIPQPHTVMESMSTPWPHTLSVSHKLRVVFRFDQSTNKERDLQLSFPISIHPTLNAAGGPVHTHALFRHLMRLHPQSRTRRRARRALFGMVSGGAGEGQNEGGSGDGEDLSDYDDDTEYEDDEDGGGEVSGGGGGRVNGGSGNNTGSGNRHLPVYADREGTLLLMVGHEVVQETTDLLQPEQVDALGISTMRTSTATNPGFYYSGMDRRTSLLYSPSEASMPSVPNSPTSPTTFMEQYSWGCAYDGGAGGLASSPTSTTTFSMYSTSPDFAVSPLSHIEAAAGAAGGESIASRRHSSYTSSSTPMTTMELSLPPPYVFPPVAEDEEDYTIPPPSPLPFRNDDQRPTAPAVAETISRAVDKGKGRSGNDDDVSMVDVGVVVQDIGPSSSSSAAMAARPVVGIGSSTVMPPFGLPSPEYEIHESPLQSCAHQDKDDNSKKKEQGRDERTTAGDM